jgi:hypothetical protein
MSSRVNLHHDSEEHIFEPAEPSRQLTEVASWRLAAEIVRRYPRRFTIIELHPGGGQYDCLCVVNPDGPFELERIYMNRVGSVFVWRRGKPEDEYWAWRGAWAEVVSTEDPKPLVDRVCSKAGLAPVSPPPATSQATIAYRVIAAFLTHTAFGRIQWECRNGYEDTSGWECSVREHYFAPFAGARARLEVKLGRDVLGVPACRFWFLLRNGEPVLALEGTSGLAWTLDGRVLDLLDLYRAAGHRVWPVVNTAAGALLP